MSSAPGPSLGKEDDRACPVVALGFWDHHVRFTAPGCVGVPGSTAGVAPEAGAQVPVSFLKHVAITSPSWARGCTPAHLPQENLQAGERGGGRGHLGPEHRMPLVWPLSPRVA